METTGTACSGLGLRAAGLELRSVTAQSFWAVGSYWKHQSHPALNSAKFRTRGMWCSLLLEKCGFLALLASYRTALNPKP